VKKTFLLRCNENGPIHVRFYLYDPDSKHCGTIVIGVEHREAFLKVWQGKVDWNGKKVQAEVKIDGNKGSSPN
jgi:hypothetical protein